MKINKTNSVEVTYVSPSTNIITLSNEGVLCGSGLSIEDWSYDEDVLEC